MFRLFLGTPALAAQDLLARLYSSSQLTGIRDVLRLNLTLVSQKKQSDVCSADGSTMPTDGSTMFEWVTVVSIALFLNLKEEVPTSTFPSLNHLIPM